MVEMHPASVKLVASFGCLFHFFFYIDGLYPVLLSIRTQVSEEAQSDKCFMNESSKSLKVCYWQGTIKDRHFLQSSYEENGYRLYVSPKPL